ncbi:hypothetical protein BJP37_18590 [Moorena bouillonii PNG]|uniref:Uncharacterized protein n=1 Tax=Moorena bouillonii PNG TaxID=568701 RepID=A0A1U7N457_9CYAN|nr:hypothetical protein BJP37_18590 [Moorena bouillonii PNG]
MIGFSAIFPVLTGFFDENIQEYPTKGERFWLQVAGCRFQVSGFRFQVAGLRFQVSGCRFQVADCRLQVAGWLKVNGCFPSN